MSVAADLPKALASPPCHVCGAGGLLPFPGFERLGRVSSDCKPWPPGGRLAQCPACLCVQKVIDDRWRAESRRIYDGYSIYYQSNGVEQAVYDARTGQPSLRSPRLLRSLREHVPLPERGRMLDVGCGNGAMLRAFSATFPGWALAGSEVNDRYRDVIMRIDRVEGLHTGPAAEIPGTFDVISLIHVLEHIESPVDFLRALGRKLSDGGLLLVEVPDHGQNPFDLLVADHASHFTRATLRGLLERAGFELLVAADDWVPKELSAVARKAPRPPQARAAGDVRAAREVTERAVRWLGEVFAEARRVAAREGRFGLFGTSIAAMAVLAEVHDRVRLFVDEDPSRVHGTVLGRPVYHPADAPKDSHVFLPLPRRLAVSIVNRLQPRGGPVYHLPPDMTAQPGA